MKERKEPKAVDRRLVGALAAHFAPGFPVDELPGAVLESIGQKLAADTLVRRELQAFWNLLNNCLTAAGYRPPSEGGLDLLNLACGPCVEAAVLAAYFGEAGDADSSRRVAVRFFGMDLRGEEVEKAERRYAATERLFQEAGIVPAISPTETEGASSLDFFSDDATRLVGYREIPSAFDIVFIRHQNVWHDRVAWRDIFSFALERLVDPSGLLVITSYFDREHMIALELLKALGGEVVLTHRNPDSLPLDYPGKSADRHMAVIRRGSGEASDRPSVIVS